MDFKAKITIGHLSTDSIMITVVVGNRLQQQIIPNRYIENTELEYKDKFLLEVIEKLIKICTNPIEGEG